MGKIKVTALRVYLQMRFFSAFFITLFLCHYMFTSILLITMTLQYYKDDATVSEILCLSHGHSRYDKKLRKTACNYCYIKRTNECKTGTYE